MGWPGLKLASWEPYLVAIDVVISLAASVHVVLTKRQTRAAIGWVGLIWVSPFLGALLYVLFGINRISRRARTLRRGVVKRGVGLASLDEPEQLREALSAEAEHLVPLGRLVGQVADRPLWGGNQVEPLTDGDEAYPEMLAAIESARRSIALSTYIFYDDALGSLFNEALRKAVERGVQVRVLIDDVGSRYGWRSNVGRLREARVPVATFIPTLAPGLLRFVNLRNHRKILIVDGQVGFTGGMNLDETFVHGALLKPARGGRKHHHDLHFRITGPVVGDLMHVFAEDWEFTTNERLEGEDWFPALRGEGPTPARCVDDGPDEHGDRLLMTLLGAVGVARSSVTILTPYFLPDEPLISAIEVAALRGVDVHVIIPEKSNILFVQWATPPFLERVLEFGCRVSLLPPPFDHSKLVVVDQAWVFLGSANIDARSLRLNFEMNVECYGRELAERVRPFLDNKRLRARPLTLEMLRKRPFVLRVWNGVFRLMSPYL